MAKVISKKLKIPTIGIGASKYCDGQVLVIDDIIGISNSTKKPKFVKSYANIEALIHKAVEKFCSEVIKKKFPKNKNTYKSELECKILNINHKFFLFEMFISHQKIIQKQIDSYLMRIKDKKFICNQNKRVFRYFI